MPMQPKPSADTRKPPRPNSLVSIAYSSLSEPLGHDVTLVRLEAEAPIDVQCTRVCVIDREMHGGDPFGAAERGDEFERAPAYAAPAPLCADKELINKRIAPVVFETETVSQDDVAGRHPVHFNQPHAPQAFGGDELR